MNVREATAEDVDAIRSVAANSLSESYSHFLDQEMIDLAVEQWYGDSLDEDVSNEDTRFYVAEENGEIISFSQSELFGESVTTGRIHWIHVDPAHRGSGIGVRMLVRTREALREEGADTLQGVVLENNEVGNEFYRAHGFEQVDTREVTIGEKPYTENVYVEKERQVDDEWRALEEVESEDGTVFVSYGEANRGSKAPFYTVYRNEAGSQRYGWFCGNCNSLDAAMDSMGRIECNECGNRRKATRWDASYL